MILKGKRNFVSLFNQSRTLSATHLVMKYRLVNESPAEYRVAFIAPKKMGNAVRRNRIKRLLRESFRTQFRHLLPDSSSLEQSIHLAIIGLRVDAGYDAIRSDMQLVLADLNARLTTASPTFNSDNS